VKSKRPSEIPAVYIWCAFSKILQSTVGEAKFNCPRGLSGAGLPNGGKRAAPAANLAILPDPRGPAPKVPLGSPEAVRPVK
jgi:hypothetical protein